MTSESGLREGMASPLRASPCVPTIGLSGCADRPLPGQVIRICYPFVRDTYTAFDEEGGVTAPTWRPGVRFEDCGPYGEDVEAVADAEGEAEFTVVDTFKPGRFPERVFLTRRFVNPDGKAFGKGKLHIWTLEKFRRLSRGFQVPYRMTTAASPAQSGHEGEAEVSPNIQQEGVKG